ncbi:MAG: alkaline phosphatase family protein [Acidobacteriia bacterium]|nr:alkaline phosphatase family protein [Terriglobia bacterium]
MKKYLLCLLAAASLWAAAPKKPKLVVAIVIDQFRYDYLTRFRSEYHAGLDRLLRQGAVFTNARFIHFPTVTAVGHSTFLSGATPAESGIVGNDWYDREEGKHVTSVSDGKTLLLGGNGGEGASPRRMLVDTVGDELKMADGGKSRVIGISLKDRAAILPAGHMANGAYWFDLKSGNFVSSTYYFSDLPGWVKDFNGARPAEKYRGRSWLDHKLPENLAEMYGNSTKSPLEASPFGNELVEQFAERALAAEQLGRHEETDLLAVSFSSNDKVGHSYGMYSAEEHEVTVRTDQELEKLFQAIQRQVGLENALIVLTGDHGVAPSAEEDAANHMPGGRMSANTVKNAVEAALAKKYGEGEWVSGSWDHAIYLNRDLMARKNLDPAEVDRAAAQAAFAVAHILRVYTREELMTGAATGDPMSRALTISFNMRRSPDVSYLPEPFWIVTSDATTHGTTFGYDTHVPVIFLGPGIRAGRYYGSIAVNDIAPTLAAILEVEPPSGSVGRVLTEMWVP